MLQTTGPTVGETAVVVLVARVLDNGALVAGSGGGGGQLSMEGMVV